MAVATSSRTVTLPASGAPATAFDFTKRKRWPELLITELADVIVFLLGPNGKILFSGTSVQEILGWKDSEVIAMDSIADLISYEDTKSFSNLFQKSLQSGSELLTYTRLKCKPSPTMALPPLTYPAQNCLSMAAEAKTMLFEIKGYPYNPKGKQSHSTLGSTECFFAMAAPYPSRNTAMLNTFLELKLDNERLQQRVHDLRSKLPPGTVVTPIPSRQPESSNNGASSSKASRYDDLDYNPSSAYPSSAPYGGADPFASPTTPLFGVSAQGMKSGDAEGEDGDSRKKKRKKVHPNGDQYVCVMCGRTDSPEWRKGPTGPKTLCNACGLRWAKQVKTKTDDDEGGGGGASGGTKRKASKA